MKIFNVENLEHTELKSKTTGEHFSLSAVLSSLYQLKDLFIHHEIIPPGRRASSPHSHSHREEMIFVLSGCPTAHMDSESADLKPGDFIAFKPSTKKHYVENLTATDIRILVICSNPSADIINIS